MNKFPLRSPGEKIGGLVHFGRMLDKIRVHAKGELPADYVPNLGKGFDQRCLAFLHIAYADLVARVAQGGTDEAILEWCFAEGRKPSDDEVHIWNEFMRKCGWNDEISPTLERRKKEAGLTSAAGIETMFAFIDADEGRTLA